jgi:hypothetical protein
MGQAGSSGGRLEKRVAAGEAEVSPPHARSRRDTSAAVFWRYWTASTISQVGDAVTAVALPLTAVTVLHSSTLVVGLITAASYAAWAIIGLPAGVIVGRFPLRGTQMAMDLLRAAALGTVPVAAWLGILSAAQLVLVALVVSFGNVIFYVGNSTFLPSIVSKADLTARNSLTSASTSVTQTLGPSLGGVLVQLFGAATSILVDVASYLVSAAMLRTLPRPPRLTGGGSTSPMWRSIREGWHFVVGHPIIRPCLADATTINFATGAVMALTPVFLVRTLGAPVALVGVLVAADGLGSLLGAALTTSLTARLGSARAALLAVIAAPVFAAFMPAAFAGWGLALFAVGNAGLAAAAVVFSILTRTHRQSVAPEELLPRVMATVRFVSWGVVPAGAVAAGAAATALGPRTTLWLVCAVTVAAPLLTLASPIRSQRDLIRPAEAAEA